MLLKLPAHLLAAVFEKTDAEYLDTVASCCQYTQGFIRQYRYRLPKYGAGCRITQHDESDLEMELQTFNNSHQQRSSNLFR
jgi:hypothetical protein